MREIEFRGKRIDNGEWVYGYYAKTTLNEFSPRIHHVIIENGIMWYVDADMVGQYTGLKDEHGNKIYEGDIINVCEEYGGISYNPLVVDFKDGIWNTTC